MTLQESTISEYSNAGALMLLIDDDDEYHQHLHSVSIAGKPNGDSK
jgi:hypothetical protein